MFRIVEHRGYGFTITIESNLNLIQAYLLYLDNIDIAKTDPTRRNGIGQRFEYTIVNEANDETLSKEDIRSILMIPIA
jgi:hypothetical protein